MSLTLLSTFCLFFPCRIQSRLLPLAFQTLLPHVAPAQFVSLVTCCIKTKSTYARHTLPHRVPVPVSSWCVLCQTAAPSPPGSISTPTRPQDLPSSVKPFLAGTLLPGKQAGHPPLEPSLCLRLTSSLVLATHVVMCLPSCQTTASACVSSVTGWEQHPVSLRVGGWISC